jgi:putative ABC transport system permease protein
VRKLSSLGSRSLAHRKGRSLLTGGGIVLGVAILFGVLVANATTQKGVDDLIETITGRADVVAGPVGAFDASLPNGSIEELRTLPDVDAVVGGYGFGTALRDHPDKDDPDEPTDIGVSGIIPSEAQKLRDYDFAAGRFARPGRNEIAISSDLAEDIDVGLGDSLTITGRRLTQPLVIVGIVDLGAEVGGFDESSQRTFTSVETARRLQGDPPGTFVGASLILNDDVDVDRWIGRHHDSITGVRLQNAQTMAAGFKEFLGVFGTLLTFFATITLFVGAFLIYLTLSMAVIERTRMYGTLRALGASRKQVRRVVLVEAVALGVVSSIAGLILGLGLALGLLQLIGRLFDLEIPGLVVSPGAIIGAILVGLVTTVISALVPAVRAGRLAPVEAMKGDYARDTRLGRAWIAGAILFVVGVAMYLVVPEPGSNVAVIAILFGAVLLVPLLLRPLAMLLGRVTNRIARGVGEIAVLHLAKERSRSAYTLALIMVVMSMLFATGGMYLSVRGAISDLIADQFGADLFVGSRTPDDGRVGGMLAARGDVEAVSPVRVGIATTTDEENGRTRKEEIFVNTVEPASYFQVSGFAWKDGNDDDAKAALERGGRILVAEDVAIDKDLEVGDRFELETRRGVSSFEVAGIYAGQFGPPEISMGIKDARVHLSAGRPNGYRVALVEGADPEAVGKELRALPNFELDTETQADVQENATDQVGQFFQIIQAILAIAAIVGLLGLANTLAMSVLQRFREIGILRAIGVTRSQAWRMVLVESATMGLTAFVLSIPLGWILTTLITRGAGEGFGNELQTVYPYVWVPFVLVFGVVVAVLAAIAPGRRAARLHVVNALQYE